MTETRDLLVIGRAIGYEDAAMIVSQHFRKANGQWTSAKAKACYDELIQMIKEAE